MLIVNVSIYEIEDVAENDRCERHAAPILTQPTNTKSLSDQGGIYSKQEPIGQASETRDETKYMGIIDAGATDLGNQKDGAGHEEAPETGHAEFLYDEV